MAASTDPDHDRDRDRRPGALLRAIFAIPVYGWLLRDALAGDESALAPLLLAVVAAVILSVLVFGYPALIVFALTATAVCLTAIAFGTRGS